MIHGLKTAALFCSLALLAHSATAHAQQATQAPPYTGAPNAVAPSVGAEPAQNGPAPQGNAAPPQYPTPAPYTTPPPGGGQPPPYAAPPPYPAPYAAPYAPPYPGAPVYAGSPDAGRNAYVQNLLARRQFWLERPVGLAVPLTLFGVGMGAIVVGSVMANAFDGCDSSDIYDSCDDTNSGGVVAGVLLWASGAVLATVGTGIFVGRMIRRGRRGRELRRIDSELQGLGVTASLAPWVNRSASGSSGGLTARLRF